MCVFCLALGFTRDKGEDEVYVSVCGGEGIQCVCEKEHTTTHIIGGGGGGGENRQPSTSSGNQGQALESASLGASDPHPMKEKMRCATPCVWRREDSVCGRGLLC